MLSESACHTDACEACCAPSVALTFHRHWNGKAPLLDDSADVDGQPCAMCGEDIEPEVLVRLRVQKPVGPVNSRSSTSRRCRCISGAWRG